MSSQRDQPSAAHQSAVSDILGARRKAHEWAMKMTMAANLDWNSPIVNDNTSQFAQHPQRPAHAYTLFYTKHVANSAYWPREKDLFVDDIETPSGDVYEVEVPVVPDDYEMEVRDGDVEGVAPTLQDLETTTETLSLETLTYKWEDRTIEFKVRSDSVYHQVDEATVSIDLWLPPKAISLALQQLDELAATLGFLADAEDTLPTWGFEEVQEDDAA